MIVNELPPATAEDWCERHLDVWCAWKHGWVLPQGLPDSSQILENYTTIDRDSERAYEELDAWIAQQVQLVIDGLVPAQKAALYRAYNIVNVYVFPRGNYGETLAVAKGRVLLGLRRRSVWCGE